MLVDIRSRHVGSAGVEDVRDEAPLDRALDPAEFDLAGEGAEVVELADDLANVCRRVRGDESRRNAPFGSTLI